jgi:membrane-associated protease RseP (regulator of RpoE activity)
MSDLSAVQLVESATTDPVGNVRAIIGSDLTVESVETPQDPRHGAIVLRGRLTVPSHMAFRRWLLALRPLGYTPMLRHDANIGDEGVAVHVYAGVPPQARSRPWVNLLLFILTVISTLFVGSLYGGDLNGVTQFSDLFLPQNLIQGWPFAFTLLGILLAHEFGHYFAARYHKVAVTLPFFIPLPVGFGTLGAFIQLKEPVPDRRKLFDIGVAGPLAGLILAIPLLFVGLSTSPVDIPPVGANVQLEGNSVLYYFAKVAVFGKPLPDPLTGEDVFMNQVTFAAWIGLLVTALNLLPVGQLDGGHTVYALFGRAARYANMITLAVMALLAIAGLEQVQTYWPELRNIGFVGWWMWLGLIIFVLGPFHPPALDDVTKLDNRRRWLGYLVILIFILTFVPTPFREL